MRNEEKLDDYLVNFSPSDVGRIVAARNRARVLHQGQLRASGEDAVMHPERVSAILAGMGMDADAIITALLHHAFEGGKSSKAEIAGEFGERAAELVDELHKIAALKAKNKTLQAAETIRKMLFAMARDVRVIIVKLADKLDNMRTIKWLPELDRKRIATECIDVFAPLADRLGISWLKDELEDLSLKEINREAFDQIKALVSEKKAEREEFLQRVSADLESGASEEGIKLAVSARAKHFYSIYLKMRKRSKSSDELYDLSGIRVLCDTPTDCYAVLGIAHRLWKPLDGRFKDYIAMPKPNGYQSLHTTVLAYEGRFLEIQIRTADMHKVAEFGVASHWLYKKGSSNEIVRTQDLSLINKLKDWSAMLESGAEFLEDIKRELLKDSIIVFTPAGDAIELTAGACAIDFAYAIHSDVGSHCLAAKADGSIISLSSELKNAQVVEIVTGANAHPNVNWLQAAKTSKAKSRIRQWLVTEGHVLAIDNNVVAKKHEGDQRKTHAAEEKITVASLDFHAVHEESVLDSTKAGLSIAGGEGLLVRFAACCKPSVGDRIVGYVSRGRGIIVHQEKCTNLASISEFVQRRVDVSWEISPDLRRRYEVHARRTHDLFSEIDNAVKKHGGQLLEGKLEEVARSTGPGGLAGSFTLSYATAASARIVERNLRHIPSIIKVRRVD